MFLNKTEKKAQIPADDEVGTTFELHAKNVDVAVDSVDSAYFKSEGSDTAKNKKHTGFFSGFRSFFSSASTGTSHYAPLVDKVEDLEIDNQVRPFSSK